MEENLKQLLEKKETEIRVINPSSDPSSFFHSLNHIIEIKNQLQMLGYFYEIYSDLKKAIKYYFNVIEEKQFGYDVFRFDLILKRIKYTPLSQQIELLSYLKRLLIINEYHEILNACDKEINKAKLSFLKESFSIKKTKTYKNIIKIILLWSSLSIYNLLISLFVFFAISYLFFLPAPFGFMEVIKIHYEQYSNIFILNHAMNILSMFFNLDEKMKVIGTNFVGLSVVIFGKICFVVLIINYIVKEILNQLKSNERFSIFN